MPSIRYLKVRLCRLLTGRGLLILVPALWICVLMWSARTADLSMRSGRDQRFAEDSLHPSAIHFKSKPGKRSAPFDRLSAVKKRSRTSDKSHQNVKSLHVRAEGARPRPDAAQDRRPKGENWLEKTGLLLAGGEKKKSSEVKQTRTLHRESKDPLGRPVLKFSPEKPKDLAGEAPMNLLRPPNGVAVFRGQAPMEQHQRVPTIPVHKDVDYKEVLWHGAASTRRPILPGTRWDPPKMGERGRPVRIAKDSLSAEDRSKWDSGWTNHKFNEYVSTLISVERDVPDYRPSRCHIKPVNPGLPRASIIICFYNEAWSVLLRTIHSVFRRSSPELISEVILVDDFSNMEMMHKPLEQYVASVTKLRLLRMTRRSGLVRARLAGIREAVGPVVIFLDSHVECEEGWLPPLLEIISQHPDVAVTPGIDVINHRTFDVENALGNIGGMDFEGLVFNWMQVLPRMEANQTSEADVVVSPTMAGGLFAIDKQFFLKIGTYDPGLELWGGENIELSLKLWMCGGGIFIHPCSRVAHIFREVSPYLQGETSNVVIKNSARVAQVWLDDYKKFYFDGEPYNEVKYGNVEEQQRLRKSLQCKSFGWYLEHVYPELYIDGSGPLLGKITSSSGLCIHRTGSNKRDPLVMTDCALAMRWEMTRMKEIRSRSLCMEKSGSVLVAAECDLRSSNQMFVYTQLGTIYHPQSRTCLDVISGRLASLVFQRCTGSNSQSWTWPSNPHHIPYHESSHR